MIYFCADDYGLSSAANRRIETCLKDGILNKVSVLPNGQTEDFHQRLSDATLSLHLNLVEGRPLSNPGEIPMLVTGEGTFRYSFLGLFFHSLFANRKELEKQLYTEIRNQLSFWKNRMPAGEPLFVDSHQHTHMIPLVLKAIMRAVRDEGVTLQSLRFPAEPLAPYLLTPSLYLSYRPSGLVKHWLLVLLGIFCRRELKKANLTPAYFMGVMFSGHMTETVIQKLLPKYSKLADKHGRDIEITLHPGYLQSGETFMDGCRPGFKKFYFSPWRKREYDTLMYLRYE